MKETNEANINENDVAAAINDINNGNCSIRSAAAEYGIQFATLQYRLGLYQKKHQQAQQLSIEDEANQEGLPPAQSLLCAITEVREVSKYSTQQVFSFVQETKLADYLITCSKLMHGLTKIELRKFTFQYAIKF